MKDAAFEVQLGCEFFVTSDGVRSEFARAEGLAVVSG